MDDKTKTVFSKVGRIVLWLAVTLFCLVAAIGIVNEAQLHGGKVSYTGLALTLGVAVIAFFKGVLHLPAYIYLGLLLVVLLLCIPTARNDWLGWLVIFLIAIPLVAVAVIGALALTIRSDFEKRKKKKATPTT